MRFGLTTPRAPCTLICAIAACRSAPTNIINNSPKSGHKGRCVPKKLIPAETLTDLERKLAGLPQRSPERRRIIDDAASFYGVSEKSLYRALRLHLRPKALRRSDHGVPRVLPREEMEHYCQLIAAMKVRTSNQKGRCLSTRETIRLLEEFGIETPEGLAS